MPSALVFIANGTEEMEFTIAYDTLTRAGVKCTSVLVNGDQDELSNVSSNAVATCSRGVKIIPDATIQEVNDKAGLYDILVVPGGAKGAETISENAAVQTLVRSFVAANKLVGMICAGSLAAKTAGSVIASIPLRAAMLIKLYEKAFDYREDPVVVSNNLITSRGPGTAFPFALELVEIACGKAKRIEVEGPMVFPHNS